MAYSQARRRFLFYSCLEGLGREAGGSLSPQLALF